MRHQVALDKWRVTQAFLVLALGPTRLLLTNVGKGNLTGLSFGLRIALLVGLPMAPLSRLDDHTREKLREHIQQTALHGRTLDLVSIFRESRTHTEINCLRQMIVELLKELLFHLFAADCWIFNQCVRYIVCSHPIKEELTVSFILFLLVLLELDADEVPESVRDQRFHVLHGH